MINLKKHSFIGLILWTLCIFSASCVNSKKIVYFNNIQDTTLKGTDPHIESAIQKNDLLSITVSSLNPQASSIFNLSVQTGTAPTLSTMPATAGANGAVMPTGTAQTLGYLVAGDGTIKFPVLGTIHAEGLTKKQLEKLLADSLTSQKLLVDPIVNVRFLNFRVTVLGEVARPTTINVGNEKISILEALGLAGDLTIYGKRENVLLIREEGESKVIRRIDLNSEKILSSPYYYLKTNDIVYVEPNKSKIASTSRTQQLLPIILSALSFVAIIVTYTLKH
ncbi:MAG: polysaccharide biosynthesis/export family protein [Bacteroidetes bacterium]|nr:polysaccharide biosynthesis/export family protein [Bacteroidota bacterium]